MDSSLVHGGHLALALVDVIEDALVADVVNVDVSAQALPHGASRLLPLPFQRHPINSLKLLG